MKLRNFTKLSIIFALILILSVSVFATEETLTGGGTNPLYGDLIQPAQTGAPVMLMAEEGEDITYQSDLSMFEDTIRSCLKEHDTSVTLYYQSATDITGEELDELFYAAANAPETSSPVEGDYIRWGWRSYGFTGTPIDDGDDSVYSWQIVFNFSYYTTAAQEAEVTSKIDEIIADFGFTADTDDFTIVRGIYHYLVNTVDYDHESLALISKGTEEDPAPDSAYETFSAYAALVKGKSVCQGYALSFYLLAETLGVDTRLIPGESNDQNHAWNIVKLGDYYYNLDATWDANSPAWSYFLLSEDHFAPSHTRFDDYLTTDFTAQYPVSGTDYDAGDDPEAHFYTESVTTEPTCTEQGYTSYFCPCGDSYVDEESYLDAAGHSYADGICGTCGADKILETVPRNVNASVSEETGKILVSWDPVVDAEQYYIYKSCESEEGMVYHAATNDSTWTDVNVIPGFTYYYRVGTVDPDSERAMDALSEVVFDTCICAQPVIEISLDEATGRPIVSWEQNEYATGYNLMWSVDGGENWNTMELSSEALQFFHMAAQVGETYTYKVQVLCSEEDRAGHSVFSQSSSIVCESPIDPPVVTAINNDDGLIVLQWEAVSGAVRYNIYRSREENGEYEYHGFTFETTYIDTEAEIGEKYYYKVNSEAGAGDTSGFSQPVSMSVKLLPPVPTSEIVTSTGCIRLNWQSVEGVSSYAIYRATSADGVYTQYDTTSATTFTDGLVTPGVSYYYKVQSVCESNPDSNSELSGYAYRTADCARPVVTASITASSGNIKLSWPAVTGASKYEIYRATSANGTYTRQYTTTSTSYTNTTGTPGTTYYYKVKAICGKSSYGNSALSAYVYKTKDCARPVVSASVVASSGNIKLEWESISGATKYEIYRATSASGTYTRQYTTTSTIYTNTTGTPGTTYYYKVKAICGKSSYGNSALSTYVYKTKDCARPVVNASVVASSGNIKLSWSEIPGATKYEIYRSTSPDAYYSKQYTTTSTSYTNTSGEVGQKYYYKVKAVCGKSTYGNSAFSKYVSKIKAIPRPVVTATTDPVTGKILLDWNGNDYGNKFYIYRSEGDNSSYQYYATATDSCYTNTSVKPGTRYYYKVKAVCSSTTNANSAQSTEISITADCAKPVVSIAMNTSGKPKLSWSAVTGATKYYVYRSTSFDGTYKYLGSTTGTTYTNTSAVTGTEYYYKVKAVGKVSAANSALSTPVGTCGDRITWYLTSAGKLVITGSGEMWDFERGEAPWSALGDFDIKSVSVADGVTSIGNYAFFAINAKTVTIPGSVVSIGEYSFCGCQKLTTIKISSSVTQIGVGAFSSCRNLTTVYLPKSLKIIEKEAFDRCDSLVDVFYAGTATQWNKITIRGYNIPLLSVDIIFGA